MFFIPLFGAAVTGQNWNVAGWKKALVSLAGPVPGVALGVGLALAGLISGRAWLNNAAVWLLLINGFNLLPVLPLDGGHVLHATLFCRNRWLDIAFRIVAIVGLVLLALAGMGNIFLFIAIALAIALPVAFKMGKVTDALRGASLPAPLPGEDRIPLATAQAIISAVKTEMPAKTNNKTLAQQALNVFETLNARPPGVFGTLGLLTVQAGSILLAAICGFLLILDKHGGGLRQFASAVVRQPQHEVDCGSHVRWSGDAAGRIVQRNIIVTTFDRRADAKLSFHGLTNRLPAASSLSLIGDSLLLTLPASDDAARERWFNELQNLSTNLFVVLTNRRVGFSMMCLAPNESTATNLEIELGDYFHVANLAELVPPWSPMAKMAGFESTRHARRLWRTIGENITGGWGDAESKALNQQLTTALRRGAQSEVERLSKEQVRLREQRERRAYDRLLSQGFDPELLDLHARLSALSYTNRSERAAVVQQVAARLGVVAPAGGDSQHSPPHYDATGYVKRHGLLLELGWVSFRDAAAGIPALVDWVCDKRCRNLKYDVHAGPFFMNELEE